jgi:hypothetical protein
MVDVVQLWEAVVLGTESLPEVEAVPDGREVSVSVSVADGEAVSVAV